MNVWVIYWVQEDGTHRNIFNSGVWFRTKREMQKLFNKEKRQAPCPIYFKKILLTWQSTRQETRTE